MVDREALARKSRRAAEWGRLRSAGRVAFAVVPFTLLAMLISPSREAVGVIGLLLLVVAVGLGWMSGEGARAARSGLRVGAIPLAVALLTIAADGWCDPDRALTACGLGCLVAGTFAGGATAWYAVRTQSAHRLLTWAKVGLVASLTSGLGCVGLGLGSALAMLAAMALGAALAWGPARARV